MEFSCYCLDIYSNAQRSIAADKRFFLFPLSLLWGGAALQWIAMVVGMAITLFFSWVFRHIGIAQPFSGIFGIALAVIIPLAIIANPRVTDWPSFEPAPKWFICASVAALILSNILFPLGMATAKHLWHIDISNQQLFEYTFFWGWVAGDIMTSIWFLWGLLFYEIKQIKLTEGH